MNDLPAGGFAHLRLDAYHIAQDLATECVQRTKDIPRGFAEVRCQAQRSALATVRHIAEGAERETPADKSARFILARSEVAELDATLDTAIRLALVPPEQGDELRALASRVGAMLNGLIRRQRSLQ